MARQRSVVALSIPGCTDEAESSSAVMWVFCASGCHRPFALKPAAAQLLLALDHAGGSMLKGEIMHARRPTSDGVSKRSERASVSWSITRLQAAGFIERIDRGIQLAARGHRLLAWGREQLVETAA